jgi:serine/threonine protein kinase
MDLTSTEVTVGTSEFMSPEQTKGENMDTRADMYSLCVVLYECVTGQHPFQSVSAIELLTMHLEQPLPRADDADGVSRRCADLIDCMLAKTLAERFATWDDAIAAAEPAMSGNRAVGNALEPLTQPAAAPGKRKPKGKPKPRSEDVSRRDVERIAEQMNAKSVATIVSHIARSCKRDTGKTIAVKVKGQDLEVEIVNATAARIEARRIKGRLASKPQSLVPFCSTRATNPHARGRG